MSPKPLWIDLRHVPRSHRIGHLRAAREAGADAVLLEQADQQEPDLPTVRVDAEGGLWRGGQRIGSWHEVADKAATQVAAKAKGIAVVAFADWRVIPLEALVAARRKRPGTLFAVAASPQEAQLFATTLESGAHGIVLRPNGPADIAEARRLLGEATPAPAPAADAPRLVAARVTAIEPAGLADRACLDCTTRFAPGEGLAVGATAASLALVHAETLENPHIPPRPFRVNAGAVAGYTLAPDGKAPYLCEAAAGLVLTAWSASGKSRPATVARVKVERRPHLLVRWEGPGGPGHAILQEAETVNLVDPDGKPRPVTALRPGDRVLVVEQPGSRHVGEAVDAQAVER